MQNNFRSSLSHFNTAWFISFWLRHPIPEIHSCTPCDLRSSWEKWGFSSNKSV